MLYCILKKFSKIFRWVLIVVYFSNIFYEAYNILALLVRIWLFRQLFCNFGVLKGFPMSKLLFAIIVHNNYKSSKTRLLAATTLRNTLGLHSLQEILQEKEKLAHSMKEHLDTATHAWYNFWNNFITFLMIKFYFY